MAAAEAALADSLPTISTPNDPLGSSTLDTMKDLSASTSVHVVDTAIAAAHSSIATADTPATADNSHRRLRFPPF